MARRRQIGLQQNQETGATGGEGSGGEGGGQNRSQGRPRRRWRPRNPNAQGEQAGDAPRADATDSTSANATPSEGQQGQPGTQRTGQQRRRGRRGGGRGDRPRPTGPQSSPPANESQPGQPDQEPKKLLPSQRPEFAGEGDTYTGSGGQPGGQNNRSRSRSRGRRGDRRGNAPGDRPNNQQGQPAARRTQDGSTGGPQGDQQPRQVRPDIGKQGIRQTGRQGGGRKPGDTRPQYALPRTFDPNDPDRTSNSNQRRRNNRGRNTSSWSNRFDRPAPSIPIKTDQGIRARSQRGAFSKNWWAKSWIEAMERLVDPGRLQRGRSYARSGQVLSLKETKHGIEATVQGSRPQPYKVNIQVTPLNNEQWERVIDALAEQALFTAQLLAGEMPPNIEEAFHMAEVSLFPDQAGDLFTSCSCPDWANPCKHVAATHYILGERFDDDPFLLFRMRGRSQEQILQGLRQRRAGQADAGDNGQTLSTGQPLQPLEDLVDTFWETPEPLDEFPLTIRPPIMDMPLLKRLGEPAFLGGESLQAILKPVYDIFTRSALRAAYSEDEPMEKQPDENGNGNGA